MKRHSQEESEKDQKQHGGRNLLLFAESNVTTSEMKLKKNEINHRGPMSQPKVYIILFQRPLRTSKKVFKKK